MQVVRKAAYWLSGLCFVGSILCLVALVTALLFEVISRYGLNAPTIWAYDVAGYLTGAVFLLACPWSQRNDSNIRIDALMAKVLPRTRALMEAVFLLLLVLPALGTIAYAAVMRGYTSFITGEVDGVSAWGPRVWPFYCAAALALSALWVQCVVSVCDAITRIKQPPPMLAPGRDEERSWQLSG